MTESTRNIIEGVTLAVALLSYALGAPNLGHFFMICIAIDKIDRKSNA